MLTLIGKAEIQVSGTFNAKTQWLNKDVS